MSEARKLRREKRKLKKQRRKAERLVLLGALRGGDAKLERSIRKTWGVADDLLRRQDPTDFTKIEGYRVIQVKAAEQRDVLAATANEELAPFPEPAVPLPKAAAKTSRVEEQVRELWKDPEVRRGFHEMQKRIAEGTATLTDGQRELAVRTGFIANKMALGEISAKLLAAKTPAGGEPKAPQLTPEQLKVARRLGLADVHPKAIEETAVAMRSGFGVEIPFPKSASA